MVIFTKRPSYDSATPEQLKLICNGCGAAWMPNWLRSALTKTSSWYFDEASWNHHDFGYYLGYKEYHRFEYDNKFLEAMLRDSRNLVLYKSIFAYILSFTFYGLVRCFGWINFYYGSNYKTLPNPN